MNKTGKDAADAVERDKAERMREEGRPARRRRLSRLVRSSRFAVPLSVFSAGVALVAALQMVGEVRLVNIIILFAGGFGAGAALASAVAGGADNAETHAGH